jgi:hypothetical protein
MGRLSFITMLILGWTCHAVCAQTFTSNSTGGTTQAISNNNGNNATNPLPANNATANNPVAPIGTKRSPGPLTPITVAQGQLNLGRITAGNGTLPNDAGQVWREYDLTPYTSRLKDVEKPEQAIIDWVIRETGTDVWFSSPLGILSADKNTLRVYHKPQIQELVKEVYDRFLSNSAETNRLGMRLITVNSPNWRARMMPLLKPVQVQSSGVEAWLVSRENVVLLMTELRQRADMRELSSQLVEITNGQSKPTGLTRPRNYVRSIRPRADLFGGYEQDVGTLQEGYSLELSPLLATDGKTMDLVLKCNIDQVERMIEVPLDVPGAAQRISLQVPQLVSWRLHERFRWPTDQVLLLSCGVVAAPANESRGLPLLGGLMNSTPRADALLFIEPVTGQVLANAPPLPLANNTPFARNNSVVSNAATSLPSPAPSNNPAASTANTPATFNPFIATPNANPFLASPMVPAGKTAEPFRR